MNANSENFRPEIAWAVRILAAIAVLAVGYMIAKIIAGIAGSAVNKIPFVRNANEEAVSSEATIGHSIGQALFYLLMLVVFAAALAMVGLTQVVEPVQNMWDQIHGFLPQLVAAAAIIGFGLIFANIVKRMVQSVLKAAQVDNMIAKTGVTEVTETGNSNGISNALAWIVYALIAIPVVIAGVDALGIEAISRPTTLLLTEITTALPNVIIAGVVLAIAFFIACFVGMLVEQVLPQFGLDAYVAKLGLLEDKAESGLTASKVVANIAGIAIMLFGAVEATKLLSFDVLSDFVEIILEQGGQILFGTLIIIAGFILANVVGKVLDAAGTGASDIAAKVVKYVILGLAVILGLSRMGLDPTGGQFILNVTEYLVLAVAVAVGVGGAIAFGLGGKDWAKTKLESWWK